MEANARLIAAAPDLLEALKDILEQAEKTSIMMGADLADSIFILGRNAVAKAEPAHTPATSPTDDDPKRGRAARSVARPLAMALAVWAGAAMACGTLPTAPTTCGTCQTPSPEPPARVSASGKILCELALSVDTKVDRNARGVWLKAQLTPAEGVPDGCGDLEVDGYPDWTFYPQGSYEPLWRAYHTFVDAQANVVAGDARGKYLHLLGPQGEYLIRSRASVGGGRDFMLCTLDEAGAECHRVDGAGNPL